MARTNLHQRLCLLCVIHLISLLLFVHSINLSSESSNSSNSFNSSSSSPHTITSHSFTTKSSVFNSFVPISFNPNDYPNQIIQIQTRNWISNLNNLSRTINVNAMNEQFPWNNESISCPQNCTCEMFMSSMLNENLRGVNCSSQQIKSISSIKSIPSQTQMLIVSNNSIGSLHDLSIIIPSHQIDCLIEIDLSSNGIDHLGRGHVFYNQSHLRVLDLSHNKFRTLFAGVFRGLKRLEFLIMNNGHLKYIDEHGFDGLEMLKHLDLSSNQISSVYLELFQSISNLHSLNLSSNLITHLTGGMFASLNTLKQLDLSDNKLLTINDNSFVGLDLLEWLNLRGNNLWKIPANGLQSLKRLQYLNVGQNQFAQLTTGDFVQLSVQEIRLTNCPNLVLVDRGAFWDLPNAKEIYLDNNPRLEFIDAQSFLGAPSLKLITLHNTSLATVLPDVISNIASTISSTTTYSHENLNNINNNNNYNYNINNGNSSHHHHHMKIIHITLKGNPILCDCNIHYLYQCLHQQQDANSTTNLTAILQIVDSDDIVCASPPSLQRIQVKQLNISEIPDECPPKLVPQLIPSNYNTGINKSVVIHKKIGDRHQLQCRALGVPTPKIYWILPNGEILNETSNTNSIHIQLKSQGSLRLFHLKPRDSGTYKCIAENQHGNVTSSVVLAIDNIDLNLFPVTISSTYITLVWNGTARNSFSEYKILYSKEKNQHEQDQRSTQIQQQQYHHENESQKQQSKEPLKESDSSKQKESLEQPKQLLSKQSDGTQSDETDKASEKKLKLKDDKIENQKHDKLKIDDQEVSSVTVNHFLRSYTIHNLEPDNKYWFCIGIPDADDPHPNQHPSSQHSFVQLSCTTVKTNPIAFMLPSKSSQIISSFTAFMSIGVLLVMMSIVLASVFVVKKYNKKCQYQSPVNQIGSIDSTNYSNGAMIPLESVTINSPLIKHDSNNYYSN